MTGKTEDKAMGDPHEQDNLKFDPAELARLYADIATRSGELLTRFVSSHAAGSVKPISDELGISKAFFEAWSRMLSDPMRLAETQVRLWQDYWSLWQRSMMRLMGQEAPAVAETSHGD